MNDNISKKTLKLTADEWAEYNKFRWLAHYDHNTGENTFGEYINKLTAWTEKLRKKHELDKEESFFFR